MSQTQYNASLATREQILKVATSEFAKHGYAGAKLDAIAKEAGLNKALIYYHYKGKKELYNAIFISMVERIKNSNLKGSDVFESIAKRLSDEKPFSSILLKEMTEGGKNLDDSTKESIKETLSIIISQNGDNQILYLGYLGALHFINASEEFLTSLGISVKDFSLLSFAKAFSKLMEEK